MQANQQGAGLNARCRGCARGAGEQPCRALFFRKRHRRRRSQFASSGIEHGGRGRGPTWIDCLKEWKEMFEKKT